MAPNIDPNTGIRYAMFSADQIDNEVINQIQMEGKDRHWAAHAEEVEASMQRQLDDGEITEEEFGEALDNALQDASDNWYDDEPSHEFDIDGVKGMTTWLGGALMVWVFESPHIAKFRLCSPCVPNCCDGGSPDEDGYEGYTVPDDWFYKEET